MHFDVPFEPEISSTITRAGLAHLSGERHGDGLDLGVSLQSVLAELAAGTALLEAAEWGRGGEDVVAVQPDELKNKTLLSWDYSNL